jgi:hypothetical protein
MASELREIRGSGRVHSSCSGSFQRVPEQRPPSHSSYSLQPQLCIFLLAIAFITPCAQPLAFTSLPPDQPAFVTATSQPGDFPIVHAQTAAPIFIDTNDFPGVLRASRDLQADVARVTSLTPELRLSAAASTTNIILIGTLGKSPLVDQLAKQGKLDTTGIVGKWEAFVIQVVPTPLPGIARALVIAGSDKRGTIYGIYELSEQIGVSPWYWWADVPVKHHDELFIKAGRYASPGPAVKYRGIFLNDEAPCLTGWVHQNYGNYNHRFYTNVFELLLRLKANYLWPAMWDNCFGEDDPLNPKLADDYGIVMGTSHVEPMMRADKEWNRKGFTAAQWNYDKNSEQLRAFWTEGIERNKDYENIVTMAMRGKVDTPMSQSANIALLERIVTDQRKIIETVYHTNAAAVPQLWALYKEVQEYYEKGMRVPDDVTLLWCDDNWGDIRRLPTPEERNRAGGAGVYYHFDYVGGPRNYKWLNTVPLTRTWEQMNLAYEYGADRIWIVNVGDLKPLELPMEFFLTFACAPRQWPKEKISEFTQRWAAREFGSADAKRIANILAQYPKLNGRRKPELLAPTTFSLLNYQEADRVLAEWHALVADAEEIYGRLPDNARDAFYQLVLYPTKASAIVTELYITAGKNRLYAGQGRASANDLAERTRALFKQDAELSAEYNHKLANGKWNHFMDQTHIGYTYWQQPPSNSMPKVTEIEFPPDAKMGVAIEGSADAWPDSTNSAVLPGFDCFNQPRRFIDVFNRGQKPFQFAASATVPWLRLSATNGTIEKEQRIWVSVDWDRAPHGSASGNIKIQAPGPETVSIKAESFFPTEPSREALHGFVEADGYVSIEAAHYTKKTQPDSSASHWEEIPDYGRTLSAMTIFPVTSQSLLPPAPAPCLEYRMYLFTPGKVQVEAFLAPSLNFMPGRGARYAISFDDEAPQVISIVPKGYFVDNGVRDWEESVKDSVRKTKSTHAIEQPGHHTLKFWMVDPGVVLEKLVVDLGGIKPSYLGSPESFHRE